MRPKEYAQAVLDASYKGEFDSYMELTDSTEEEAREMYEGNVDATMAAVGFEEMGASQEMQEDYRQLFLRYGEAGQVFPGRGDRDRGRV